MPEPKPWELPLSGVAPFVAASLVKNALGAALVPAIRQMLEPRAGGRK
jgi:biotin transport system substrate-specific component